MTEEQNLAASLSDKAYEAISDYLTHHGWRLIDWMWLDPVTGMEHRIDFAYVVQNERISHCLQKSEASLDTMEAWRRLAFIFLDSLNPEPETYPVIAEAVLSYDGPVSDTKIRYSAHEFIRAAELIIDRKQDPVGSYPVWTPIEQWIMAWKAKNYT